MTLFGAVGSVAAMLAVLVPVILVQGKSLRREIDAQGTALRREIDSLRREIDSLRTDVSDVRADMAALRTDVHAVSDRVARIEGAMTVGAWRPNGAPARPDSTTEPEAQRLPPE